MLVRKTSDASTSSSARARPSSVPRSTTMLRFDRLSSSNTGLVGRSPPSMRWNVRAGSPSGGSILTTSAPQSERIPPAAGPAIHTPSSTTRTPAMGPVDCSGLTRRFPGVSWLWREFDVDLAVGPGEVARDELRLVPRGQPEVREATEQLFEQHPQLEKGEVGPQAAVGAEAERHE